MDNLCKHGLYLLFALIKGGLKMFRWSEEGSLGEGQHM